MINGTTFHVIVAYTFYTLKFPDLLLSGYMMIFYYFNMLHLNIT